MRNRFEQQLQIGILPIEATVISLKSKNSLSELLAAILMIYKTPAYRDKILSLLEEYILKGKKKTGRNGNEPVAYICFGTGSFV